MKRIFAIACLMAGAALLTGCPKKATTIQPPTAGSQVGGGSSNTAPAGGASASGSAYGGDTGANGMRGVGGDANGGTRSVIYFDFDKSDIRLEGNTDERGTREYNIGLGERRAQAVRRALMLQGVAESQISTVSFGAERPAAEGDDESAWAKNRRVELVYQP
jgi:peptidoglycan-associated lipoprotein